jgi:general secretion pathway protein K
VALVGALIVLALATFLAYSALDLGVFARERSAAQGRLDQADQLSDGLYAYALLALAEDERASPSDSNAEAWAGTLPVLPTERGNIAGRLQDLNGRFNLNSVWRNGAKDAVAIRRFERLLAVLELDPTLAYNLLDAIDPDDVTSSGAEDSTYLRMDPPRRAPNRYLSHVAELAEIAGFAPAAMAKLMPHVAALPPESALNINTATLPVLMSLHEGMGQELARRLWNRGKANYQEMSAWVVELNQAGVLMTPDDQRDLSTASSYFLAQAELTIDGELYGSRALLRRERGTLQIIWRSRGF